MLLRRRECVLVIIDVQERLMPVTAMARIAATNVLLFLRGQEPLHRVV